MGPYLGTPNTQKESEQGECDYLRFGATSMQGWRKSQEDSHVAECDIGENISVFGVFDGHGGKEVSIYVKRHFKDLLQTDANFKKGNYEQSLKDVFRRIDENLQSTAGEAELKKIKEAHGGD